MNDKAVSRQTEAKDAAEAAGLALQGAYKLLNDYGAYDACQRLSAVNNQLDTMSAEMIQRSVDTERALAEVEQEQSFWASWLAIGRNVFSLLPIALTWLALTVATIGYATELGSNPASSPQITTPFLELWQRGFNGHLIIPFLTFSTAALLDFFLLLIIVAVTIFLHNAEVGITNKVNRVGDSLSDAFQKLTYAINFHEEVVQDSRAKSSVNVVASAKVFADEATAAVKQLQTDVKILTVTLKTEFKTLFEDERKLIIEQLNVLHAQNKTTLVELMQPLMTKFDQTATQYTTSAGKLVTSAGRLEASSIKTAESATQLQTETTKLGGEATRLATGVGTMNAHLEAFNLKQSTLVTNVAAAAAQTKVAADQMIVVAGKITTDLNPQTLDLARRVGEATSAMATASGVMSTASGRLNTVADALDTTAKTYAAALDGAVKGGFVPSGLGGPGRPVSAGPSATAMWGSVTAIPTILLALIFLARATVGGPAGSGVSIYWYLALLSGLLAPFAAGAIVGRQTRSTKSGVFAGFVSNLLAALIIVADAITALALQSPVSILVVGLIAVGAFLVVGVVMGLVGGFLGSVSPI